MFKLQVLPGKIALSSVTADRDDKNLKMVHVDAKSKYYDIYGAELTEDGKRHYQLVLSPREDTLKLDETAVDPTVLNFELDDTEGGWIIDHDQSCRYGFYITFTQGPVTADESVILWSSED